MYVSLSNDNRNTIYIRVLATLFCLIIAFYFYFVVLSENRFSMELSEKSESSILMKTVLSQRVFHLDLKGAPLRFEYYEVLFPLLMRLKFTHLLFEYEDMFPYSGDLSALRTANAYSEEIVENITKLAAKNNLEIIPLVQTFGHMEFVLKLPQYAMLREVPSMTDTICPSDARSIHLINEMLIQVRKMHPDSKIIHIGADEAYQIAKDERCLVKLQAELNNSIDRLKIDHIATVAKLTKKLKFEKVWVWNDMFDTVESRLLNEHKLNSLVVPVVWGYAENVNAPGYFPPGMFERYSDSFDEIIFASAFKGANGKAQTFMNSSHYLANLISYYDLYDYKKEILSGKLKGMILTGWQRFNHNLPLCELLPVSIPVVIKEALYLQDWSNKVWGADLLDKDFLKILKVNNSISPDDILKPIAYHGKVFHPPTEWVFKYGDFPGVDLFIKVEELRLIKWKADVDHFYDAELLDQLQQLKDEIEPILCQYFYEDTVTEWISQNMVASATVPVF